jgi:hypothetical protein
VTHEKSKSGGSVKKHFDSSFGNSKSKRVISPVVLVLILTIIALRVVMLFQ